MILIRLYNRKCWLNICVLLGFVLSGCSLPKQGPSSFDISLLSKHCEQDSHRYVIVGINTSVIGKLKNYCSKSFSNFITQEKQLFTPILGLGDRLLVNIWEPAPDGLFSTIEKKHTTIHTNIDENGKVYIPYVGKVDALGKTIEQLRFSIQKGLVGKAIEPQVQVSLSYNASNNIVIMGDVSKPGRYNIPVGGSYLMDIIAQAGGTMKPAFETEINIVRGQNSGSVRVSNVLKNTENNILLLPKDIIQVLHKPLTFTAFGAVAVKKHVRFKTEELSLAEALAQVGGLNDNLADVGGVFLFRFEDKELVHAMNDKLPDALFSGKVAIIYRLDFNEPQAFFLANSFMMRDKDIIYVANAPVAEINKFITSIIAPLLGNATSAKKLT